MNEENKDIVLITSLKCGDMIELFAFKSSSSSSLYSSSLYDAEEYLFVYDYSPHTYHLSLLSYSDGIYIKKMVTVLGIKFSSSVLGIKFSSDAVNAAIQELGSPGRLYTDCGIFLLSDKAVHVNLIKSYEE